MPSAKGKSAGARKADESDQPQYRVHGLDGNEERTWSLGTRLLMLLNGVAIPFSVQRGDGSCSRGLGGVRGA